MAEKPKGYLFYPVRVVSSDDEFQLPAPGQLFKKAKMMKKKATASNSAVVVTTKSTTTRTTAPTNATTSSAPTTTFLYSHLPTDEDCCGCGNCSFMPSTLEKKCCMDECFALTHFQEPEFVPGKQCVCAHQWNSTERSAGNSYVGFKPVEDDEEEVHPDELAQLLIEEQISQ